MKNHIGMVILASLVMVLLLTYTITFAVDGPSDIVVITTFGQAGESDVYMGDDGAGWHMKWPYPIQRAIRFEKRCIRSYDPNDAVYTADGQEIVVSAFCIWEIEKPVEFLANIKSEDAASARISDLLRSSKKEVFSKHNMSEIVNTDPDMMNLGDIEKQIGERLLTSINDEKYGIKIVKIGVERITLTTAVTEQVIQTMKNEREQVAKTLETEGDAEATAIKSRADGARKSILSFAERYARDIRAEGEREAAREYKRFEEFPRLAMFLRYLETLKAGLNENTTLFLDGKNIEAIGWLRKGPSLPEGPPVKLEDIPADNSDNK